MPKDRRSFFERLTGSTPVEDYYDQPESQDSYREEPRAHLAATSTKIRTHKTAPIKKEEDWMEPEEEGQLTVDVFQNENEIIIQSTVAGVKPDDLDVSITRDMVTIRGRREQTREIEEHNYFYKELYWGTFSRSIALPQEIDVDGAQATLKQGLLTLRLPKLDKNRINRLRVKTNE